LDKTQLFKIVIESFVFSEKPCNTPDFWPIWAGMDIPTIFPQHRAMPSTLRILLLASVALAGCKDGGEGGSASDSSEPATGTAGPETETLGETEPDPSTGSTDPDMTESTGSGSTSGGTTDATTDTTDGTTDDTSGEPMCNNGIVEGDEECDNMDISFNGPCIPGCFHNICGDGHQHIGVEDCDEGNQNGTYGSICGLDCKYDSAEFCGDGVIQEEYEDCEVDDIHEDFNVKCIGCTWANFRIVFVTSMTFDGAMNTNGLSNNGESGIDRADLHCQQIADTKEFPGSFRAWLSDNNGNDDSSAASRIGGAEMEYRMPNGGLVAPSWNSLLANGPVNAIDFTEEGMQVDEPPAKVWSNTAPLGQSLGGSDCAGWAENSAFENGSFGLTATNSQWTDAGAQYECTYNFHLYCFQQG